MPVTVPFARLLGHMRRLESERDDLLDHIVQHAKNGDYESVRQTTLRLEGINLAIEQLNTLDVTFDEGVSL